MIDIFSRGWLAGSHSASIHRKGGSVDWNAMATPWLRVEAGTDAAHAPVREALIAKAALRIGQSVLDIGPGAGTLLLDVVEAVGPTGHVTGIEIAPPFAARAVSRVAANVEVCIGNAADYPFASGSSDAAISLFGVMFFADPVSAFGHISSVCKPGTALTFACWGPPHANPWFDMPSGVAAEVFGPGPAFDRDVPGPMVLNCARN
ncbi:class I SAM-dependent methyltransferase [Loktanella salsilacus]|uniref:class I SAM-dependent methyltransferase n=1 Tax=Loktanella salsilacus TaxID=195913 RepID=UPI0037048F66